MILLSIANLHAAVFTVVSGTALATFTSSARKGRMIFFIMITLNIVQLFVAGVMIVLDTLNRAPGFAMAWGVALCIGILFSKRLYGQWKMYHAYMKTNRKLLVLKEQLDELFR